jgi:hypothetical protein
MCNRRSLHTLLALCLLTFGLGLAGTGLAAPVPVTDDSLQVWFRADKGSISPDGDLCWGNGDPVMTWTDQADAVGQSGTNNATQGSANNRPRLYYRTLNFWPVVRFDESTTDKQYLDVSGVSGFDNNSEYTAFVVGNSTGSGDDIDLFFSNAHNNHNYL